MGQLLARLGDVVSSRQSQGGESLIGEDETKEKFTPRRPQSPLMICLLGVLLLVVLIVFISMIINSVTISAVKTLVEKSNANQPNAPTPLTPPTPPSPPSTGIIHVPTQITPTPQTIPDSTPTPTSGLPNGAFKKLMITSPDYNVVYALNTSFRVESSVTVMNPYFMAKHPTLAGIFFITTYQLNQGYVRIFNYTQYLTSFRLPANIIPMDILIHPNGQYLFVTTGQGSINSYTNRLLIFQLLDGSYTSTMMSMITLGTFLQRMDITPDKTRLYITDGGIDKMHIVDLASLTPTGNFSVGTGMGLVYNLPLSVGITVVSGGFPDRLILLETNTGNRVGEIALTAGEMGNVVKLAYSESQRLLLVPNGIDSLLVYSLTNIRRPALVASYPVGNGPSCVQISEPSGDMIYVTNAFDNSISVIYGDQVYTISLGNKITNTIGPLCLLSS